MLARMKMQTTNEGANLVLSVPQSEARNIEEAIRSFLKLAGHKVELVNNDGEKLYHADEIFPDSTPGTMLRGLRTRENLNQREFGARLGLKQHHISEMENNKRPISLEMAKRIGKVYGVSYKVFV